MNQLRILYHACLVLESQKSPKQNNLQRKQMRCRKCKNCTTPDCTLCKSCISKYQGNNKRKQGCLRRPTCLRLQHEQRCHVIEILLLT